jgi:hypothetical protein
MRTSPRAHSGPAPARPSAAAAPSTVAASAGRHEVPWRTGIVALALTSAVSALGGGIALVLGCGESESVPPLRLLAHTPFASFRVPGLVLASAVGGTSLGCALLVWRRSRAAADATILAGGALTVWILATAAMMRELPWLHGVHGALGLAILGLGVRAGWSSHRARHRWITGVTLAETAGFLAPAWAGILSTRGVGAGQLAQAALLVGAGLVEGLALGAGQALVFPLPVRRRRYALLTALGAGAVWLGVMSTMLVAGHPAVPLPFQVTLGLAAGGTGLLGIGGAQWIELRHHTPLAHRWIGWTALAWAVALPLSFTPSPFVDERTPIASHVALWGCAGLLMAYVMALITWQGVRRLVDWRP